MPLKSVAPRQFSFRLLLLGAAFLCSVAQAQTIIKPPDFDAEFDDDAKPWQEIVLRLPALPSSENLVPFQVGATVSLAFAIDAKSISVGEDDVVRYTLVATSPAGAKNISYEGIRCKTFEKKLYAFGHANGSWSRSRRDKWEPIPRTVATRQQATLARDYFCRGEVVAENAKAIVERIRNNRPLNPQF
jgi:hypothetical protein